MTGRVVLDDRASCLCPSFNRGELSWGELSLVRVVLIQLMLLVSV